MTVRLVWHCLLIISCFISEQCHSVIVVNVVVYHLYAYDYLNAKHFAHTHANPDPDHYRSRALMLSYQAVWDVWIPECCYEHLVVMTAQCASSSVSDNWTMPHVTICTSYNWLSAILWLDDDKIVLFYIILCILNDCLDVYRVSLKTCYSENSILQKWFDVSWQNSLQWWLTGFVCITNISSVEFCWHVYNWRQLKCRVHDVCFWQNPLCVCVCVCVCQLCRLMICCQSSFISSSKLNCHRGTSFMLINFCSKTNHPATVSQPASQLAGQSVSQSASQLASWSARLLVS